VAAYAAPALPGRPWVGEAAETPAGHVLARALGARDLALGLGTLIALRRGAPVRGWIEGGGLSDVGDVVATVLAFRSLPRWGRWLVLAAAGSGAAASFVVASRVED
jgi:hypothetical protein